MTSSERSDLYFRVLIGTAIGDSLGLPAENLGSRRIRRLFPRPWRHRFFFGRGMVSDDTEHTAMLTDSLIRTKDQTEFTQAFAQHLRIWFLTIPVGIGLATLRSCLRLLCGYPPNRSGVFSAGNGPAMRSAILGAYFHDNLEHLHAYNRASTCITHMDPRAEIGALAVALSVRHLSQSHEISSLLSELKVLGDEEWQDLVLQIETSLNQKHSVRQFIHEVGLEKGVTGYVFQTVPVAVYSNLRHPGHFREALEEVLDCGGDTDTVGAITGAIAGAALRSAEEIPKEWIQKMGDYPLNVPFLKAQSDALAEVSPPPGYPLPLLFLLRNFLFLGIVLAHVIRRLFPPW